MIAVCNISTPLLDYRGNLISPCFPGSGLKPDEEAATRPKEATLENYEAMLIVIPELDEEQVENTISRFQTIIERTGGEVGNVNHWGRRKLAYEIDNRTDGFYAVMEFTAGERTLVELKRILRVSDDVLRHIIVKLPPTYAHRPLPEPAEAAS